VGYIAKIKGGFVGSHVDLPGPILERWPELGELRYRRGGLPLRIGGWMLGQSTVAAITIGRTIFLAGTTRLDPGLLLHELRHVQQFAERKSFALRYIWESLRNGYHANRYEVDAREYAERHLARDVAPGSREDE
jgi:hypothetical protein